MFFRHFFAVVALCSAMIVSAQAADPMGSVVATEGRPLAAGPGGSRALEAGSAVFEGDTVTVGDGNAQIELDDGTKLVVGPSSRLLLQAYLRKSGGTASKVGIKALRGTFRFITGKSPKSAYNISTSNATIGIRGTGFDFRVSNRTLLAVLNGAVRLRGRNGQVVNTQAGCGVAEAGQNTVVARVLTGQQKANALRNQLPYIVNQNGLRPAFRLPIQNCLTSLGSNQGGTGGAGGLPPNILLPLIPAVTIPTIIILTNDNKKNESVSPEGGDSNCPSDDPYCDRD